MDGARTQARLAAILNAAWMVRHYARGGRTATQRLLRTQAIQLLGATLRDALNASQDHEPILTALVDGLRPHDPPF